MCTTKRQAAGDVVNPGPYYWLWPPTQMPLAGPTQARAGSGLFLRRSLHDLQVARAFSRYM